MIFDNICYFYYYLVKISFIFYVFFLIYVINLINLIYTCTLIGRAKKQGLRDKIEKGKSKDQRQKNNNIEDEVAL